MLSLEGRTLLSAAGPGSLDPTFGTGGKVVTGLRGSFDDFAEAVAVVPGSNKVVTAGVSYVSPFKTVVALTRTNANGTLDRTFGNNGRVLTDPLPAEFSDQGVVRSVALLPGGKALVAGSLYDSNLPADQAAQVVLIRYNPDGSLDTTFGNGGIVLSNAFSVPVGTDPYGNTQYSTSGAAGAVALPNGQVLVTGTTVKDDGFDPTLQVEVFNYAMAVARFNRDGSLDTTFGTGGVAAVETPNTVADALVVTYGGDVVVAGTTTSEFGQGSYTLAAFTFNGAPDPTFGQGGVTTVALPAPSDPYASGNDGYGNTDTVSAAALAPDGSIVVAGTLYRQNADGTTGSDYAVTRFSATGRPVATFGTNGLAVVTSGEASAQAPGLAVQPNGAILVAGTRLLPVSGATQDFLVARLRPDGTPDTSFGKTGAVTTNFGGDDSAAAVAVGPDGRVVAAGAARLTDPITRETSDDFALARYTADGHTDNTFARKGMATTDFFGGSQDDASGVVLQRDGRLVVAGTTTIGTAFENQGQSIALVRYNTDGSLDTTFGVGGRVFTDFPPGASIQTAAVLQQTDNKILVVGTEFGAGFSVLAVRYNPDGSLDRTFGTNGVVTQPLNLLVTGAALQPDGRLVLAGADNYFSPVDGFHEDFGVVRLNWNGSLDTTFGTGGVAVTDFNGGADTPSGVAVQPDGRIVVVGSTTPADSFNADFALARYTPSGQLDPTFGNGGEVVNDLGGQESSSAVAVAFQGSALLVAGDTSGPAGTGFVLTRFSAAGVLDTSFGAGGLAVADFNGQGGVAAAMAVQPDGRIVVVGTTFSDTTLNDFAVARYNADGTLDTTFGTGGEVTTDVDGGSADLAQGVVIQSNGAIVVVGSSADPTGIDADDFAIVRYIGR